MEAQFQGYPVEIYYLAAFIGVALLIYSPRWAFFFVVFCLASRNHHMAVNTRVPVIGAYANLNDLFLWIGVFAMLKIVWKGQKLWFPSILLAIFAIVIVGGFQSLFKYGFNYDVMQFVWASCVFPIAFLVSANIMRKPQDALPFYWMLFLGALGAALQHLVFMQGRMVGMVEGVDATAQVGLRTISFIVSGGIFLVISAFFVDMRRIIKSSALFALWIAGLPFIAVSYILSFTRTVWIGAVMSVAALFFIFLRERRKMALRVGYALTCLGIIILAFMVTNRYLLSAVDLTASVEERAQFADNQAVFEQAYQTRESGMQEELKLWQGSPIIWGVGTCYSPSLLGASVEEVGALNHVAFSAYLAHYGLIGLFVYVIFLPLLTIKLAKRYFLHHSYEFAGVIAMMAMALAFYDIFTSLSSNHYLIATGQVHALIYGSFWGLSRTIEGSSPIRIRVPRPGQRWLLGPKINSK